VKAALKLQGIDAGAPRLPLMPLDEARTAELSALMAAAD
jgi:dihydrodipicolinate synthase/N-acetylneuraminate lyase